MRALKFTAQLVVCIVVGLLCFIVGVVPGPISIWQDLYYGPTR
jgi:hypothetical protein